MTLLERLVAPAHSPSIDNRLRDAMASVPGAIGLAIAHSPSGTRGLLVIDATREGFFAAEDMAMQLLVEVRRDFRDSAIDVLCVRPADADVLDIPPDVQVYSLQA